MVQACGYLWLALGLYWIAMAMRVKRTKARESLLVDLLRRSVFSLVLFLDFAPFGHIGWLGLRFVPERHGIGGAGVALTAVGVILAAWARRVLGRNWSGAVMLKEGHELISRGPYARIRHPIYTGVDLAVLGTALAVAQWRGAVAFVLAVAMPYQKARTEEAWLTRDFGVAFEAYRARTGMFLPRMISAAGCGSQPS